MRRSTVICLLALVAAGLVVRGEYVFFTPKGSFAVEVSLENSPELRLPIHRNAITSLEVVGDYAVGGTSARPGLSPFLFAVSLTERKLVAAVDLKDTVPGQRAIQSGFARGPAGTLWAGTMPDRTGEPGHLVEVRIDQGTMRTKDLGIPVPGEGVFALTADRDGKRLYGISHPSGRFFVYERSTGRTAVLEETAPSRETLGFLGNYSVVAEDVLARRLVLDGEGRVYGSMPINKLFRYHPGSNRVEILSDELPEVWGHRPLGRVDSWAIDKSGILYGGNAADGQLFRLDPKTGKVTNLGKPAIMPRIKGLAFGSDGKLYGVAGGEPGYAHLFSYAPEGKGFVDLGNPRFLMKATGIEQGIAWRGFQIGTVAASEDGKWIVLGEEEALSQLMVFPVDVG